MENNIEVYDNAETERAVAKRVGLDAPKRMDVLRWGDSLRALSALALLAPHCDKDGVPLVLGLRKEECGWTAGYFDESLTCRFGIAFGPSAGSAAEALSMRVPAGFLSGGLRENVSEAAVAAFAGIPAELSDFQLPSGWGGFGREWRLMLSAGRNGRWRVCYYWTSSSGEKTIAFNSDRQSGLLAGLRGIGSAVITAWTGLSGMGVISKSKRL